MMWLIAGGLLGALFGEWIGREYWLWGLVVGVLVGHGQLLRTRKASEADVEALSREVAALRERVDAVPAHESKARPVAASPPIAELTSPMVQSTSAPLIDGSESMPLQDTSQSVSRSTDELRGGAEHASPDDPGARPADDLPDERPVASESTIRAASAGLDAAPSQPDIAKRLLAWLVGGNAVVRIGVVVLFFGVAFLLKHAYERVEVPVEVYLVAVFAGAIVLLVIGWRLRERRPDYALVMQGGAISLLYLTVFGAFKLWALIAAGPAFAILIVIAGLAAMLAILQNALVLAVIGTAGGFLAPILVSTGQGSHVMLFSYYAVLNLGIATVALFKAWRALNLLGFVFTFAIALVWADRYYQPEFFATTEPFLVFHFLLFLGVTLLFARQRASLAATYVDGTLVFGVPIVGFAMQWGLVRDTQFGLAYSAIVLGAIYLGLGGALLRGARDRYRMLVEAFLALGIIFGTLAIPLALTGKWTIAAWALEGAGLVWVGLRQSHLISRVFGLVVQVAAIFAFGIHTERLFDAPYIAADTLSMALLAGALLFTSRQYAKHGAALFEGKRPVELLAFVVGAMFWIGCGAHFLNGQLVGADARHAFLVFAAASAVFANAVGVRLPWLAPRIASQFLALIMVLGLGASATLSHPFAQWGWAAWPIAFAALIWIVYREENHFPVMRPWRHAIVVWMMIVFLTWEASWQLPRMVGAYGDWSLIAWGLVPALAILLITQLGERIRWPIAANHADYIGAAAPPIVAHLVMWLLIVSVSSSGKTPPLPYVPMLNPVDLAQIAALLAAGAWYIAIKRLGVGFFASLPTRDAAAVGGLLVFFLFNTVLLRTLHHFAGVAYSPAAMLHSALVQATLAIAWSAVALGLMFIGTKKSERRVWIAGAVLLGIVVVKLLFLDLARQATVMRIVAFIGVGVLMLVIGYLAPLPPRAKEVRT